MQVKLAKIAILDEYLAIRSRTGRVRTTTATVDRAVYRTDHHASVNLVYHSHHGRPRRREENRTEFNCTQRQIWSRTTCYTLRAWLVTKCGKKSACF